MGTPIFKSNIEACFDMAKGLRVQAGGILMPTDPKPLISIDRKVCSDHIHSTVQSKVHKVSNVFDSSFPWVSQCNIL